MGVTQYFTPTAEMLASRVYKRWNLEDCERWLEFAKERGAKCAMTRKKLDQIEKMDLVPAEPFRLFYEALIEDEEIHGKKDGVGMAVKVRADIVRELKKIERRDKKDYGSSFNTKSFGRKLGSVMDTDTNDVKTRRIQLFMTYQLAEACCKAMGLVPYEVGV